MVNYNIKMTIHIIPCMMNFTLTLWLYFNEYCQSLCCHHVSAAKQRSILKTATPAAIKIPLLLFRWPPSSLSLSLSLSSSYFSQMQSHLQLLNQNSPPPVTKVTLVTAPAHVVHWPCDQIQETKSSKRASPAGLEAALAPLIGSKISPKVPNEKYLPS